MDRQSLSWRSWSVWVPLAYLVIVVGAQLLVPPVVGVADNGDFERVTLPFGLSAVKHGAPFQFVETRFHVGPPAETQGYVTSEWLFVPPALVLNRLFSSPGSFRLEVLGLFHGLGLVVAVFFLLRALHRLAFEPAISLAAGFVVVWGASDAGNVAYFNSFFTEQAAFIFMVAALAGLLELALGGVTVLRLVATAVVATLFVFAKPQLAPAGLIFGAAMLRAGFWAPGRAARLWGAALGLLVVGSGAATSYFAKRDGGMVVVNKYHAVACGILEVAPRPEEALAELGLSTTFAENKGVQAWGDPRSPDFESARWDEGFAQRVSYRKIVLYYLQHPAQVVGLFNWALERTFVDPPFWLGNYTRDSGKEGFSHPQTYVSWSRSRNLALSALGGLFLAILGGFLVIAPVLLFRRARSGSPSPLGEVWLVMALLAASQLLTVPVFSGLADVKRHLYPFLIATDAWLLFAVVALTAWLGQKISATPHRGRTLNTSP